MPVLSASPLSAFVLVLGGFGFGDTSVRADMIEVSPSIFEGAAVGDMAVGALASAGPVVDAVLFRGMTVVSMQRCGRRSGRERGRESAKRSELETKFPSQLCQHLPTRRCEVRGHVRVKVCQTLGLASECSVSTIVLRKATYIYL